MKVVKELLKDIIIENPVVIDIENPVKTVNGIEPDVYGNISSTIDVSSYITESEDTVLIATIKTEDNREFDIFSPINSSEHGSRGPQGYQGNKGPDGDQGYQGYKGP